NGKMMFFASDRPGGYGGLDLYYVMQDQFGEWTAPKNCGPTLNTPYNEDSPYLHPDGKTLYFSSEGHNSIGGYDVFQTRWRKADSSFVRPANIGYPINGPDDDIFFVLDAS